MNPGRSDHVYVSSSAIRAATVAQVFDECERRGLTNLELTSSVRYEEGQRRDVIAGHRRGFRLLLHNYFPTPQKPFVVNLASSDDEVRRRSIDHCRSALELSAEVGAPFFSVHAGFAVDPNPGELGHQLRGSGRSLVNAARVFYESVATVCEHARDLGLMLLIENNVLSRRNLSGGQNRLLLGVTPDDFDELFEQVPNENLGLLLDVGHLKVSTETLRIDRARALERLQGHARAVHLSDNDATVDDNRPFGADAWFVRHLPALSGAACVIETGPLDGPALVACVRVVEDAR